MTTLASLENMPKKKRNQNQNPCITRIFISFTSFSIASLFHQSTYLVYLRSTPHSGSPTTQDPVFALNEQYSTGQSDPHGRHQWNGTVALRRQQRNRTSQAFPQSLDSRKHPGHRRRLSQMGWISDQERGTSGNDDALCTAAEP